MHESEVPTYFARDSLNFSRTDHIRSLFPRLYPREKRIWDAYALSEDLSKDLIPQNVERESMRVEKEETCLQSFGESVLVLFRTVYWIYVVWKVNGI